MTTDFGGTLGKEANTVYVYFVFQFHVQEIVNSVTAIEKSIVGYSNLLKI